MNWEAIAAVGEIVGATAVVVSLVYLAVQIRQNTRSNRVSAELGTLEQLTSWVRRFSTDKDAQRIWDLVADGSEPISPEDSRQWLWLIGEFFLDQRVVAKSRDTLFTRIYSLCGWRSHGGGE